MFRGVNIAKIDENYQKNPATEDHIMALVYAMDVADTNLTHYEPKELITAKGAETLGITPALDANKKILAYNAVSEFFRLAPDATLYFIAVPSPKTVKELAEDNQLKSAIRQANDVKGIAFAGTTSTITTLESEVASVQALVDSFKEEFRYIDFVLLEGKGATDVAITDYPNFRDKACSQVAIVAYQDPMVASLDPTYRNYACIGSALGNIAVRMVHENMGSVDIVSKPISKRGEPDYTMTFEADFRWLKASLSDGTPFENLAYTEQEELNQRGIIFAGFFADYPGIFLSNDPTCINTTSAYSSIRNNRTFNKMARAIRGVLIPKVRGVVNKDPLTGYIQPQITKYWQALAEKPLLQMQQAGEISGFEVFIDHKQYLSESSPVKVAIRVVYNGVVYEFDVDLGLTDKLN